MNNSKIEWTDDTFNPWWGCTKVSEGCRFCYADALSRRYGHNVWGQDADRRFLSEHHWKQPERWNKQAEQSGVRKRVFCASMADVFEDRRDLDPLRERLLDVIERTSALDWQLLSKRPENVRGMVPAVWMDRWPDHVWVGTTVENQEWADRRTHELLRIPARIKFFSVEPLLGPIQLALEGIHWVIVGGESGVKARPMELAWARGIRDQSARSGVAFFMKQLGGQRDKRHRLDQIPHDLQIREFPDGTVSTVEAA